MANLLDEAFTPGDGGTDGGAAPVQGQPAADQTSAVQPEGQGQPDAQTGLYDLSTVPEQYRSEVERIAKDIDRNVQAKLREAAEFRKSWEPFHELGLHEYDPEGVGHLLQFAQELGQGGDAARDAILNLAETLGLDLGQSAPADPSDPDPNAPMTRAEFEQWQAQQRQAAEDAAELARLEQEQIATLRAEYAEVEKANGKPFTEEEKKRLVDLARRFQHDSDTPIKAAFELINSIAGGAEAGLIRQQPQPPAPAEPAGRASTTVKPVDTFEEAERLHRERMAASTL